MGVWGSRAALEEVFPQTHHQRCWVHKSANVLDNLPKTIQAQAKAHLHQMYFSPTRQEQERRISADADEKRRNELRRLIQKRETEIADEAELERMFERHIEALPADERPRGNLQKWRKFGDWENRLKRELADWKRELEELKNRPIDKRKVFKSARSKVLHLLHRTAKTKDLLDESDPPGDHNGRKPDGPTDHLRDYLIPVITRMREGRSHTEAFRVVAEKLRVRTSTVASQCTRALGLNTEAFKEHVRTGRVVRIIKNKREE